MNLFLILIIICLIIYIINIKRDINTINIVLDDISTGNFDRRLIPKANSITANLSYKINELVINHKKEIIKLKESEKNYKKLITSLSHDIRTPLASLIGYLDAINSNLTDDKEKTEFLEISLSKAFDLKDYIDTLFQWMKLESKETIFNFIDTDIYEETRTNIGNWIPQLENSNIDYEINIPEDSLYVSLDKSSYHRILNNLIQNILSHSNCTRLKLDATKLKNFIFIEVADNGKGISEDDIPFIFDRLYKCNSARGATGNGLGLSIVKELINSHKGEISVKSSINSGTSFKIKLPISNNKVI